MIEETDLECRTLLTKKKRKLLYKKVSLVGCSHYLKVFLLIFQLWQPALVRDECITTRDLLKRWKVSRMRKTPNANQITKWPCLCSLPFLQLSTKAIYTKYSKHWPYTVAHTIDCVRRKCLIVCVLAYLNFIFEF